LGLCSLVLVAQKLHLWLDPHGRLLASSEPLSLHLFCTIRQWYRRHCLLPRLHRTKGGRAYVVTCSDKVLFTGPNPNLGRPSMQHSCTQQRTRDPDPSILEWRWCFRVAKGSTWCDV
jgi:hypothetical protein